MFLKKYRAWMSASIVTVAKNKLPALVETHMDEKLLRTWVGHFKNVLYLTLKCASDNHVDGED